MEVSEQTIACVGCGTVNDLAMSLVASLREEITLRDRELGQARAQLARARGQQAKSLEAHPHYREAVEVLEEWKALIKPAARELTGAARLKPTLARLGEWSVEELKLCVLGYGRFPYVVDRERSAHGSETQWYADVDTIFANAKRVEAGIRLASKPEVQATRVPASLLAQVPWQSVWQANRKLIVESLTRELGPGLADAGRLMWPCPRCSTDPLYLPLSVASEPGSWIARCCSCGLSERQLIAAITDPGSFDVAVQLTAVAA